MNDLREKINLNLDNPDELEQLNHNNPEEFKKQSDKLNDNWTAKTTELYNYVAKYLDERGIPTSKAKEDSRSQ